MTVIIYDKITFSGSFLQAKMSNCFNACHLLELIHLSLTKFPTQFN